MDEDRHYPADYLALLLESCAFDDSIRAMRKAMGKRNPEECEPGSDEQVAAQADLMRDVFRALALLQAASDGGKPPIVRSRPGELVQGRDVGREIKPEPGLRRGRETR